MFNGANIIQDIKLVLEYPHLGLIVSLIFLFLALNPKDLYGMWMLQRKLDRGEALPNKLANFPSHQTSIENYLNSKEKIDLFVNKVLKGNSCQIKINSGDINNIYLHGEPINKYKVNFTSFPVIFKYSNKYLYFQITDGKLLQKTIKYLSTSGIDGIATETRETRFKNQNSFVLENHKVVEWNGRKIDSDADWSDDKFYSLSLNDLFLSRLFASDFMLFSYDENESQRKLMSSVIEKITSIEIANENLIIKVEQ